MKNYKSSVKLWLNKYWHYGVSFLLFLTFYLCFQHYVHPDNQGIIHHFQETFLHKEVELNQYLKSKKNLLFDEGVEYLKNHSAEDAFYFHIYENDSLIYWNTNELPIMHFADIHFPSKGLVKLQNAWYYSDFIKQENIILVASFLIKKEYAIENEFLENHFADDFEHTHSLKITLEKEHGFAIKNGKGKLLFYLQHNGLHELSDAESNLLMLMFGLGYMFLLLGIHKSLLNRKVGIRILTASLMLVLHYLTLRWNDYRFLDDLTFFDPAVYSSSRWFPNLFFAIINILMLHFFLSTVSRAFKAFTTSLVSKISILLFFAFGLLFTWFIGYFYQTIIDDSTIPLEIDKLFRLNYYSFWASLIMGVLFFSYFHFIRQLYKNAIRVFASKKMIITLWLLCSILFFCYEFFFGCQHVFSALWPLVINGIILLNVCLKDGTFNFNFGVVLLFCFTAYISTNIEEFLSIKEQKERELFAQQLASDQDISTEFNHLELKEKITKDPFFEKLFKSGRTLSVNEFKDYMEKNFYNQFWDRYEIDFYLFDRNDKPLIDDADIGNNHFQYFENILYKHSKRSEVDTTIFYIKDYTSQLSYIDKLSIFSPDSSTHFHLYTTFKSKRIPEKIGFPRLLISKDANVFKQVESYSIAKYYNGKLVSQNGKFSYPTEDFALSKYIKFASGYFDSEEYNHFLYRKSGRDLIVLSKKKATFFQKLTSFSYLFCFFGFFLLILAVIKHANKLKFSQLTLALKIQLVLISILVVSLIFFGLGSGKFVDNQYNEYSNELIKEKSKSVMLEIEQRFGNENELKIDLQGDAIQYYLKKFGAVFVTDINLYDKYGFLLGSSRPKVYNAGLLSEQMNPQALKRLRKERKSEFIHQEKIGNLNYLSAYSPLYNDKGNFLAYVNLQHFGQQQGIENQIESFLVAIINVFILLLAFSIILSVLVSNWVIAPLKVIQNSLGNIQLGKYNQPIAYNSKDEIGSLVKQYNEKLEELSLTAQQLAQSERESAWREMAKQVAHEIKNPLTPMKLSLQHLQRIFDPNDPQAKDKLDKVVYSIVEQIDALTSIANEFSNFAKMPKENREVINLKPLIANILTVFEQENEAEIHFDCPFEKVVLLADKELMIRVFNNLIKNAIQAIPQEKNALIDIRIWKEDNNYLIEIKDNGKGISEELIPKIFVPNFTTKSTGTGLGLAMVKQIIEVHDGKIWFETEPGLGTSFFISLPGFEN